MQRDDVGRRVSVISSTEYYSHYKRSVGRRGTRFPLGVLTGAGVGELGVEVLIRRLRRGKLLLQQTEGRHELPEEDARPVAVPAETAHDVVGRPAHDSEVLVEQSHVDRQQVGQSDGQTAAQTDVRVPGVHRVQH